MASGAATVAPLVQGGLLNYQDEEEFIAVLVTNIYLTDPSSKDPSKLRRDHISFKTLESDLAESFTFFRSSVFDLPPRRKILPREPGLYEEPCRGEGFV